MKEASQRYVPAGILMVWGVVLAYFCISGRIASYLHPAFHIWTAASAGVLVLMAAGMLFLPGIDADCCDGDHDHPTPGNSGSRIFGALVLVVPLITAAILSPSEFGATAVLNRGYVNSIADLPGYKPYTEPSLPTEDGAGGPGETVSPDSYMPKNEAGQIQAQTIDLIYAAEEPTMREDFENKEVEMIGQYMPAKENNQQGNRFNLVRMFVMCCAADARPVAVPVQMNPLEPLPEMSWIKVTGRATFPVEGGRRVPVVVADSIKPCDPPDESFIY